VGPWLRRKLRPVPGATIETPLLCLVPKSTFLCRVEPITVFNPNQCFTNVRRVVNSPNLYLDSATVADLTRHYPYDVFVHRKNRVRRVELSADKTAMRHTKAQRSFYRAHVDVRGHDFFQLKHLSTDVHIRLKSVGRAEELKIAVKAIPRFVDYNFYSDEDSDADYVSDTDSEAAARPDTKAGEGPRQSEFYHKPELRTHATVRNAKLNLELPLDKDWICHPRSKFANYTIVLESKNLEDLMQLGLYIEFDYLAYSLGRETEYRKIGQYSSQPTLVITRAGRKLLFTKSGRWRELSEEVTLHRGEDGARDFVKAAIHGTDKTRILVHHRETTGWVCWSALGKKMMSPDRRCMNVATFFENY
jgi:hypothetical protein